MDNWSENNESLNDEPTVDSTSSRTVLDLKPRHSALLDVDKSILFHHHIHSFYFNDSRPYEADYLLMKRHALAMSYDSATHYFDKNLPGVFDSYKRIISHNAYNVNYKINFIDDDESESGKWIGKPTIKYGMGYMDALGKSTINPAKTVFTKYDLEQTDLDWFVNFTWAIDVNYLDVQSVNWNPTLGFKDDGVTLENKDDVCRRYFQYNSQYNTYISNFQSKYVTRTLAEMTVNTVKTKQWDHLFLDDLLRFPDELSGIQAFNKDYGNEGHYDWWKLGQLAFIQQVRDGIINEVGRQGGPIKIFANIWSPYEDRNSGNWYASNSFRADHYYYESAGSATLDLGHGIEIHEVGARYEGQQFGQETDGTDDEGLPAYRTPYTGGFGYIPANRVGLCTHTEYFWRLVDDHYFADYKKNHRAYTQHHKIVAGTALNQGSWFGWYGEVNVHSKNSAGNLVIDNLMQLLRAIPNWENLSGVPLNQRFWNRESVTYSSEYSEINNDIAYSFNPINGEVYVVFSSINGGIPVSKFGRKMASVCVVDDVFMKREQQARHKFKIMNDEIVLTDSSYLNIGFRVLFS